MYKNELITLIIIRSLKLTWTSATSRQPPHNMYMNQKTANGDTLLPAKCYVKTWKNLLTKLMLMRRQTFVYSTEKIQQSLAECNWPKFYSIFSLFLLLLLLFWFLNDSGIRWKLNRLNWINRNGFGLLFSGNWNWAATLQRNTENKWRAIEQFPLWFLPNKVITCQSMRPTSVRSVCSRTAIIDNKKFKYRME